MFGSGHININILKKKISITKQITQKINNIDN
jgi:hypothetical protein